MATAWSRRHDRAAAPDSPRRASALPRVLLALLAALAATACAMQHTGPVLVDDVTPRTADTAGGLVIVHGQNFAPGAQVQAGGTLLLTTWINSHYLAARLPLELAGSTVDIVVRNPDGSQARLRDALTLGPLSPRQPQVASAAPTPTLATPSPTPTAAPSATPALTPTPSPTPELVPLPATTALPTPPRIPVARPSPPPVQVMVPPPAPYTGPAPVAPISPIRNAPPQQSEPAPAPAEQPAAPPPPPPPPQNPQPVATRVIEPPPPPVAAPTQTRLVCPPGLHIPPDAARQVTCF